MQWSRVSHVNYKKSEILWAFGVSTPTRASRGCTIHRTSLKSRTLAAPLWHDGVQGFGHSGGVGGFRRTEPYEWRVASRRAVYWRRKCRSLHSFLLSAKIPPMKCQVYWHKQVQLLKKIFVLQAFVSLRPICPFCAVDFNSKILNSCCRYLAYHRVLHPFQTPSPSNTPYKHAFSDISSQDNIISCHHRSERLPK